MKKTILSLAVVLVLILALVPTMPAMASTPGTYNPGDIATINAIITNNGLDLPLAPADGSSVPAEWGRLPFFIQWSADAINKRVITLIISNFRMSTLDISGLTELTELQVPRNNLTSIDVTQNTKLTWLSVLRNRLTTLDVSNNTELLRLNVSHNRLTTLDVSNNTALESLNIGGNQFISVSTENTPQLTDFERDRPISNNNPVPTTNPPAAAEGPPLPIPEPYEQVRSAWYDTASEWAHDAISNARSNGWFGRVALFTDNDNNHTILHLNPTEFGNDITRAEFMIILVQWIQRETGVFIDEWHTRFPAQHADLTFMGATLPAGMFEMNGVTQRLSMRYIYTTVMEHPPWTPGLEGIHRPPPFERRVPINLQDLHDNHQVLFMKNWARADSVVAARRLGIASTDNLNEYITRQEAATMIMHAVSAVNLINAEVPLYQVGWHSQTAINAPSADFTDMAQVSSEYAAGVTFVRANDIMGDASANRFDPQGFITVERAIVSINNIDIAKANINSASPCARAYITKAIAAGLVPQSLQFNYTQAITRAEFCALAVILYEKIMGEITGRVTFTDTDDVNVQKMGYVGILTGVVDNRFAPNDILIRERAAVMLARLANAMGKPFPTQAPTFADNNTASAWALIEIGRVQAAGIMSDTGDNNFSPRQPFTREQSIITFLRFFEMVGA